MVLQLTIGGPCVVGLDEIRTISLKYLVTISNKNQGLTDARRERLCAYVNLF